MKQAEATADRIKDFYRRETQGGNSASLLIPLGSPFLNYHSPPPPKPKRPFRLHSPQGSPSPPFPAPSLDPPLSTPSALLASLPALHQLPEPQAVRKGALVSPKHP